MINIGRFQFSTEAEYFKYALGRYFRKSPPLPINRFLSQKEFLDPAYREEVARTSDIPSVINTLVRDEQASVRRAAMQNDFFLLIGRLQDVLGFGKKERREFAKQEVFRILLVLLMFEDDLEIISEVLQNASISIKMISIYIQLIQERGIGRKDQLILAEAKKALYRKKMRIIKAAEINKARKAISKENQRNILIFHLADEDKFIRKAVKNFLIDIDPKLLIKLIHETITNIEDDDNLKQFIALSELYGLILRREDLKHLALRKIEENPEYNTNVQTFLKDKIQGRRRDLIERCVEDLTNFGNILLLTHGHCDPEKEIRDLCDSLLTMEDLFSLVKDISTPQDDFKSILTVLQDHPDERVHDMVLQTYEEESERLRGRMRELETMLRAYFDVIFQSIGFPEINQYLVAIKALEESEKVMLKFNGMFDKALQKKLQSNLTTYVEVKNRFNEIIHEIESDTSQKVLMELEHIQSMIEQIVELKNFDIEGLRPGAVQTLDEELLQKAKRIWQNALGQYLGRIKNLDEMLKVKFRRLAEAHVRKSDFLHTEFDEVFNEIEQLQKEKLFCTRPTECVNCNSRGCAAERFLTEVRFLLDELLDNFVEDIA